MMQPGEIVKRYPQVARVWTAGDIGYLLRLGLVDGKKYTRSCYVDEKQVLELSRQVKK